MVPPSLTNLLQQQSVLDTHGDKPTFYRLKNPEECHALEILLKQNPHIIVCDRIDSQLRDLVKLENPSITLSEDQYSMLVIEKLDGHSSNEYGVWVYYPWRAMVVHMLDEKEFVRVRTIRNAYKITFEEQAILAKKKIGVIGLSVGQSVALTIAIERTAGEIRIADFDHLELSNLNRLRTTVNNIGIKKTTIVAREICEIDPYLKVVCFNEGVNIENINQFLIGGEALDLLIEECDSVEIKILSRERAKEYGIPVIMDTSDRGMVDIERFDIDREYPILHGLVDKNVTFDFLSGLQTSEEKLPYILPILGVESISTRLKASALEVGKSISTWPQLCCEVVLGGALCAYLSRQILLGKAVISGRKWIDLEKCFNLEKTEKTRDFIFEESIPIEKILKISDSVNLRPAKPISTEVLKKIVQMALAAPSAGNNQNFKWHYTRNNLILYIDKDKEHAFSDNMNIASLIGVGCSIENLVTYSNSIGLEAIVEYIDQLQFPAICSVHFIEKQVEDNKSIIENQILERRTTRSNKVKYSGKEDVYDKFDQFKYYDNAKLGFVRDSNSIEKLGRLICKGDRIRLTNPQGHQEFFKKEIRWRGLNNDEYKDGLDIRHFDLSASDFAGLQLSEDISVIDFINSIHGGQGFERISSKNFNNAHAIGYVLVKTYSKDDLIDAGRLIERMWLKATELDLGIFPMTVIPMLTSFIKSDEHKFNDERALRELISILSETKQILSIGDDWEMAFMFKTTGVEVNPLRSNRHNVEDKLIIS